MKKKIAKLSLTGIFVYLILMAVVIGCKKQEQGAVTAGNAQGSEAESPDCKEELSENSLMAEEAAFRATDNRGSYETVYYVCASDFIADCGFKEEAPFWEYDTEEGGPQLKLYYDEASGEGCGIRYYPGEENKKEEGFRFLGGFSDDPRYSLMEAWVDLAVDCRLSWKRSTGKTLVSRYEESVEDLPDWPHGMLHFESKGVVGEDSDGELSFVLEIDWQYREDETLQKKEYRHNAQVFGTYRSSADYYYGKDGRLLCQEFYTEQGCEEVYYIYGEDEMLPEYYLHIDPEQKTPAELVSYDTEIPEEDKLYLDEERILDQFLANPPFYVSIDHYDDEGNVVVHLFEGVEQGEDSHVTTSDWITVNPDTGIGIDFRDRIVNIVRGEDRLLYYRFLNGQIGALQGGEMTGRDMMDYYCGQGPLDYVYMDLNDDDIRELLIYPRGNSMQILTIDREEVCWVDAPFYSGATREFINENKEIVMVDESHAGRNQYSVYRLNDGKELEDVIFFQVWFGGEGTGLVEDSYTKYIGGLYKGSEEAITKEEFDALYEQYIQNESEIEWREFKAQG